jgi:hypothetical protein
MRHTDMYGLPGKYRYLEKHYVEKQQTNLSYQLFKNESTPLSPYKVNNVMYINLQKYEALNNLKEHGERSTSHNKVQLDVCLMRLETHSSVLICHFML